MPDAAQPTTPPRTRPLSRLDRYFSITERGSSLATEVRGGVATFFTMAYIVVLNPLIIGTAADADGVVLGVPAVAAATALVAGVLTILMGVVGRYPFAIAAGLGLNAFRAIPAQLKTAIGVGIGLFIALIGFVDSGFVRTPAGGGTPLELGIGGSLAGWPTVVFVVAVVAGGLASTSSNTTCVESAAGVGEGAWAGLASVVTGALFLLAVFFTPLVSVVPFEAARLSGRG